MSLDPKALCGLNPFIKHKYLVMGDAAPGFVPGIHRENVTFAGETAPPPPPPPPLHPLPSSLPEQGLHLFVADHKKVPFDFPSLYVSCKSVTASGL